MRQWDKVQPHTKIPKSQFLLILNFCLKDNNYFNFDGNLYHQTFGMPMGNPLSPTIADIILDTLLDETIDVLKKSNIYIKFIAKYVDDILAIVKKSDLEIILKALNQYHQKLQFTVEIENNNSLAFLDTTILKTGNRLLFNWYAKPTSSGRMINFHSTHPIKQKINTANNLINKALDISDTQFHEENIQKIRKILRMNSFPNYLINELINNKTRKITHNRDKSTSAPEPCSTKTFHSIGYIPKLTNNKLLHQIITNDHVTFAHKPNTTLNKIFTNTKAPIKKLEQHNVVYEIKCKGNADETCEMVYIGTTKRALQVRMSEHQNDVKKNRMATGLAQHIIEKGHTADFDKVTILDKENKTNTRLTLESLRIQQKIRTTMNTQEDKNETHNNYSVAIKQQSVL